MRALRRNRRARSGFLRAPYRHCSRSKHWRVQPLHVFRTRFSRPAGFPRPTSVSAIPDGRSTSIQDVAADVSNAQIAVMPLRHGERIKSTLSEVRSSRSCGGDDLRRRAELDLAVLLVERMTTRLSGSPFNLGRRRSDRSRRCVAFAISCSTSSGGNAGWVLREVPGRRNAVRAFLALLRATERPRNHGRDR